MYFYIICGSYLATKLINILKFVFDNLIFVVFVFGHQEIKVYDVYVFAKQAVYFTPSLIMFRCLQIILLSDVFVAYFCR